MGRFLESLRVMKALWTQEKAVERSGRFWQLKGVPMEPKTSCRSPIRRSGSAPIRPTP